MTLRNRTAVTGAGDGDIRIWDLRTRNCEHILKGHECHVKVLQFDDVKIQHVKLL